MFIYNQSVNAPIEDFFFFADILYCPIVYSHTEQEHHSMYSYSSCHCCKSVLSLQTACHHLSGSQMLIWYFIFPYAPLSVRVVPRCLCFLQGQFNLWMLLVFSDTDLFSISIPSMFIADTLDTNRFLPRRLIFLPVTVHQFCVLRFKNISTLPVLKQLDK